MEYFAFLPPKPLHPVSSLALDLFHIHLSLCL